VAVEVTDFHVRQNTQIRAPGGGQELARYRKAPNSKWPASQVLEPGSGKPPGNTRRGGWGPMARCACGDQCTDRAPGACALISAPEIEAIILEEIGKAEGRGKAVISPAPKELVAKAARLHPYVLNLNRIALDLSGDRDFVPDVVLDLGSIVDLIDFAIGHEHRRCAALNTFYGAVRMCIFFAFSAALRIGNISGHLSGKRFYCE
jgi:hypothetical protein